MYSFFLKALDRSFVQTRETATRKKKARAVINLEEEGGAKRRG
jgi:hypothetical protein